jgi:hypothetical protein
MTKIRVLVLFSVLLFAVTLGVSAQTTADLDLQGVVAIDAYIDINALPVSTALALDANHSAGLKVADLTYRSNNAAGFGISVASTNGFVLLGSEGLANNNSLAYSMRIGTGTAFNVDGTVLTSSAPQVTNATSDLLVVYTGSSSLYADTYTDSLTFTITAN